MLRRSVAWRDKNECEGDNSIGIELTNPIIFALRPHYKTSFRYNQLSNGHIYKSDSYGWSLPDTSIQWKLDTATNLYITKSSVSGTIFFAPVIVWKCTKENFDKKKPLLRTNLASRWALVISSFHCMWRIGTRKQWHVILSIVSVLSGVRVRHHWWLLFRAAATWLSCCWNLSETLSCHP